MRTLEYSPARVRSPRQQEPARQSAPPRTGDILPEKARAAAGALLNARLSDAIYLWRQTMQAYWNVKGPHFIALQDLFVTFAADMGETVDLLIGRVVQLQGLAQGTLQAGASLPPLGQYPPSVLEGKKHLGALALGLASFSKNVKDDMARCGRENDARSAEVLAEVSRVTDKYLWFVEAILHLDSQSTWKKRSWSRHG